MCDVTKVSVSAVTSDAYQTLADLKGSAGRTCYDIRCCYTPNKHTCIAGKSYFLLI